MQQSAVEFRALTYKGVFDAAEVRYKMRVLTERRPDGGVVYRCPPGTPGAGNFTDRSGRSCLIGTRIAENAIEQGIRRVVGSIGDDKPSGPGRARRTLSGGLRGGARALERAADRVELGPRPINREPGPVRRMVGRAAGTAADRLERDRDFDAPREPGRVRRAIGEAAGRGADRLEGRVPVGRGRSRRANREPGPGRLRRRVGEAAGRGADRLEGVRRVPSSEVRLEPKPLRHTDIEDFSPEKLTDLINDEALLSGTALGRDSVPQMTTPGAWSRAKNLLSKDQKRELDQLVMRQKRSTRQSLIRAMRRDGFDGENFARLRETLSSMRPHDARRREDHLNNWEILSRFNWANIESLDGLRGPTRTALEAWLSRAANPKPKKRKKVGSRRRSNDMVLGTDPLYWSEDEVAEFVRRGGTIVQQLADAETNTAVRAILQEMASSGQLPEERSAAAVRGILARSFARNLDPLVREWTQDHMRDLESEPIRRIDGPLADQIGELYGEGRLEGVIAAAMRERRLDVANRLGVSNDANTWPAYVMLNPDGENTDELIEAFLDLKILAETAAGDDTRTERISDAARDALGRAVDAYNTPRPPSKSRIDRTVDKIRESARSLSTQTGDFAEWGDRADEIIEAAKLPTIEELSQLSSSARLAKVREIFDGTFAGHTVKTEGVESRGAGFMAKGRIYDADGNPIGNWERKVTPGDPPQIYHALLSLNSNATGNGFSNAWIRHLENWYIANGVKSVEVSANIHVGGYTWARHGFDWNGSGSSQSRMTKFVDVVNALGVADDPEIAELIRRYRNGDIPTPFELSSAMHGRKWNYADIPGSIRGDSEFRYYETTMRNSGKDISRETFNIGQMTFLGSSWSGTKPLLPPANIEEVREEIAGKVDGVTEAAAASVKKPLKKTDDGRRLSLRGSELRDPAADIRTLAIRYPDAVQSALGSSLELERLRSQLDDGTIGKEDAISLYNRSISYLPMQPSVDAVNQRRIDAINGDPDLKQQYAAMQDRIDALDDRVRDELSRQIWTELIDRWNDVAEERGIPGSRYSVLREAYLNGPASEYDEDLIQLSAEAINAGSGEPLRSTQFRPDTLAKISEMLDALQEEDNLAAVAAKAEAKRLAAEAKKEAERRIIEEARTIDNSAEPFSEWGDRGESIRRAGDLLPTADSLFSAATSTHRMDLGSKIFNGQFGNLRTVVTSSDGEPDGSYVYFEGSIFNQDGVEVGAFRRAFHRYGDETVAHHDLISIKSTVQGGGFASDFNRHLEDWYIANGIDRIELVANISVGGYAWARQGYDWQDPDDAHVFVNRLNLAVQFLGAEATHGSKIRELEEIDNVTPFQIATFDSKTKFSWDEIQEKILGRPAISPSRMGSREGRLERNLRGSLSDYKKRMAEDGIDVSNMTFTLGQIAMLGSMWDGERRLTPTMRSIPERSISEPAREPVTISVADLTRSRGDDNLTAARDELLTRHRGFLLDVADTWERNAWASEADSVVKFRESLDDPSIDPDGELFHRAVGATLTFLARRRLDEVYGPEAPNPNENNPEAQERVSDIIDEIRSVYIEHPNAFENALGSLEQDLYQEIADRWGVRTTGMMTLSLGLMNPHLENHSEYMDITTRRLGINDILRRPGDRDLTERILGRWSEDQLAALAVYMERERLDEIAQAEERERQVKETHRLRREAIERINARSSEPSGRNWDRWGTRAQEIESAARLPSVSDLAVLSSEYAGIQVAQSIFGGTFGSYEVKVNSVDGNIDDGDNLNIYGEILNSDGEAIGEWHRAITPDNEVVHELLDLYSAEDRGSGFSNAWIRHLENWYIANGIDTVHVHANISVGGYAWARHGFDWQDGTESSYADNFGNRLRQFAAALGVEDHPEVEELLDGIDHGWSPTPLEFAMVARSLSWSWDEIPDSIKGTYDIGVRYAGRSGMPSDDARFTLGKLIFLGSDWYGTKTLTP